MTEIYLTISLSTYNGDDTPQNYVTSYCSRTFSVDVFIIQSYCRRQSRAVRYCPS